MTPDDLPDDKPLRIYLVAGYTFFSGGVGFWMASPELGHFWSILNKGFCLFLVWLSWALVTVRPGAATLARDSYLVQAGFFVLISFGLIGSTSPGYRFAAALSVFINLGLCFILSRKKFLLWYLPVRRGVYINERT